MSNPSKPNIILINCDDLGYGDLGCYGSSVNATPVLDAMAAGGTRFTDFYMAASLCSPSRGSMMTGCYPPRIGFGTFDGHHGVLFPGFRNGLSTEETTVATLLKDQGYATAIVGKWHCGDQPEFLPTRHGFDSYYGIPFSNDMGRQAGGVERPPLPLLDDETVIQQQPDQTAITERYVERCVRFIRENREGPFFLYFAHMHVHLPLYAAPRFMAQAKNGPYGACVEAIDWATGVILHELRTLGIDENTLVVFTSDNGSNTRYGGSNRPLRGRKAETWEGGIRVPMIARWPGVVPEGGVSQSLCSAMDFLPTFAALAGIDLPTGDDGLLNVRGKPIDGRDIAPLLRDPATASPHSHFFYYWQNKLNAVRDDRWKLHVAKRSHDERTDGETLELYDLANDIGETTNVADQHPQVVQRLQDEVRRMQQSLGDERHGIQGRDCRPAGEVANAKPLTEYDENHPYIIHMYDLEERG